MTFANSERERPRRAKTTETTALARGTNAPLLLPAKATATCPHGQPPSAAKRAEGARYVVLERAGGEAEAAPGVRALGLRANASEASLLAVAARMQTWVHRASHLRLRQAELRHARGPGPLSEERGLRDECGDTRILIVR